MACTASGAHPKEDRRHSFTTLSSLEILGLLITTSISGVLCHPLLVSCPGGDGTSRRWSSTFLSSIFWRRQQVVPTDCALDRILRVIRSSTFLAAKTISCVARVKFLQFHVEQTGHDTHSPQSPMSARCHPKKHTQSLPPLSRRKTYLSMTDDQGTN